MAWIQLASLSVTTGSAIIQIGNELDGQPVYPNWALYADGKFVELADSTPFDAQAGYGQLILAEPWPHADAVGIAGRIVPTNAPLMALLEQFTAGVDNVNAVAGRLPAFMEEIGDWVVMISPDGQSLEAVPPGEFVQRTNLANYFPGGGGGGVNFRQVSSITERNSIPPEERSQFMLVGVGEGAELELYVLLVFDNDSWARLGLPLPEIQALILALIDDDVIASNKAWSSLKISLELSAKANQSALETTNAEVATKADQAELDDVSAQVGQNTVDIAQKSDVGHTHTKSQITDLSVLTPAQIDTVVNNAIAAATLLFPAGLLLDWPAANPPAGALVRDGAYVLKTDYTLLYNAIGGSYDLPGDDDLARFRLPDDRDRYTIGAGGALTVGSMAGANEVDLAHTHEVDPPDTITTEPNNQGLTGGSILTGDDADHTHNVNIPSFQSGSALGAHDNRPASRAYLPIIIADPALFLSGVTGGGGAGGSGGSSSFTGLLDTPGTFLGSAGFFIRVNQAGDGLEFVAINSGIISADIVAVDDTNTGEAHGNAQKWIEELDGRQIIFDEEQQALTSDGQITFTLTKQADAVRYVYLGGAPQVLDSVVFNYPTVVVPNSGGIAGMSIQIGIAKGV